MSHNTQHTCRFHPTLIATLKRRATIVSRPLNSDVEDLLSRFFAEPGDQGSTGLGDAREAVGVTGEPLSAQHTIRLPRALAELVQERAARAGHGFNREVNNLLVLALARQKWQDDDLVNEFRERIRQKSLPQPELPDVSMTA